MFLLFCKVFSRVSLIHTSYLSFLLHGQDFWVLFCSTQKYVNRYKMDFAPKQHKSRQDSIHCKFVKHDKQFSCAVEQVCLWCEIFVPHDHQQFSCEANLLHMNNFSPRTMSAASAKNMMYGLIVLQEIFWLFREKILWFFCEKSWWCFSGRKVDDASARYIGFWDILSTAPAGFQSSNLFAPHQNWFYS